MRAIFFFAKIEYIYKKTIEQIVKLKKLTVDRVRDHHQWGKTFREFKRK